MDDLEKFKEARICSELHTLKRWGNFMIGYLIGSCLEGWEEQREVKAVTGKAASVT